MSGITVPTIDQIKGPTVMSKLRDLITHFIAFAEEVNDKIDEPLAQAEQAVATANSASATANSASATANSASELANEASELAEEASATVAGYNTRLTNVENTTQSQGTEIQHLGIETNDLYDRDANDVKLDVNHVQTIENGLILKGINKTSNTSVGELNDMIVNAKRLIEEINSKLNAYEHMIRTTGNQIKAGQLTSTVEGGFMVERSANYSIGFIQKNDSLERDSQENDRRLIPLWVSDMDGLQVASLRVDVIGKTRRMYARIIDSRGVEHDTTIATITEP